MAEETWAAMTGSKASITFMAIEFLSRLCVVLTKLLVTVCWLTVWPAKAAATDWLMLGVNMTIICWTKLLSSRPLLLLLPTELEKLLCPLKLLLLVLDKLLSKLLLDVDDLKALAMALWICGFKAVKTLLTIESVFLPLLQKFQIISVCWKTSPTLDWRSWQRLA